MLRSIKNLENIVARNQRLEVFWPSCRGQRQTTYRQTPFSRGAAVTPEVS
jgi:hypothetical protein